MSNLNVPSFQSCAELVFSILSAIALALALVSTFCVLDVTSKGPKEELEAVSFGKFLKFKVTLVAPVCEIKSGINLLIFIINSPSPLRSGTAEVVPLATLCVISKSPDVIFAVIAVTVPPLTWSVPVSC